MNVNNKVIVVTGAGSGIGRELAIELIERGASVAAVDINRQALKGTEESVDKAKRKNLSINVLDLTDKSRVDKLPKQVIERHGNVDGVINNAGIIQPFLSIKDIDFKSIERVVNVNFFGTLYMTKAFLPHLLKRPCAHIVNVSSMGGFLPVPGQTVYGATKAGVKLLTEGLYSELLNTNVRVSVVFPGTINTNIIVNSGVKNPLKKGLNIKKVKMLSPRKAAQIILDGMQKDKPRIFVGADSKLMDILYRVSPAFATTLIARKIRSYIEF